MSAVRDHLRKKLDEAFARDWDPVRPTRAETVEEGAACGLRFLARRRDGSWAVVHEEPPAALATVEEADDFLATALSKFLMKHPGWPR